MNPKLNVNGDWKKHKGYVTKILGYYADEFLMSAAKQEKPFLLYLTPNTPHEPAIPAPGSERYFRDMPPHRPPNYLEEDQSDKPDWLKNRKRLDQEHIDAVDQFRIRQFQSLRTFDGVVGSLIDKLQELSLLENTMVFYISDNGVMWGEHGLTSKNCIYEAAIHVPFAVTAPFLTKKPQVFDELVANIDIAPTIYELSGVTPPAGVNGKSLVPLLKGGKGGHHRLLIEDWRDSKIRRPFDAVHTGRFVYVENKGDKDELYDLETDPYQLNNQIDSPGHAKRVADLKKDLAKLKIEAAPLNAGRN
jgi:N-acetylglucosamine-6-sulfatase